MSLSSFENKNKTSKYHWLSLPGFSELLPSVELLEHARTLKHALSTPHKDDLCTTGRFALGHPGKIHLSTWLCKLESKTTATKEAAWDLQRLVVPPVTPVTASALTVLLLSYLTLWRSPTGKNNVDELQPRVEGLPHSHWLAHSWPPGLVKHSQQLLLTTLKSRGDSYFTIMKWS